MEGHGADAMHGVICIAIVLHHVADEEVSERVVSAFEVLQDVRQVRGVVAAEVFEEVEFDVHRGFLSLFPLVVPPFYRPPPPRVKPQRCVLHHISGHRKLPNGRTKGSSFQLRTRNLPERNLHPSKLHRSNIPPRNITQT